MAEHSPLVVTRARSERVGRLFLGSLLLVPAALAWGYACWLPALRTLRLSLQEVYLGRPGQWMGLSNYLQLARDPVFGPALARSLLAAAVRLPAVLVLPGLVGWLWPKERPALRLGAWAALGLGLALSAPAGLGLLWRVAVGHVPWLHALALDGGARGVASCLALEFLAFLGVGGALAATALLLVPGRWGRTQWGVLALAGIAAVASGLGAFSLPFAASGGGPDERTATLTLHLFRTAFEQLRLGRAAAGAGLLLGPSLALGVLFGLVCDRLRLRLVPAPGDRSPRASLATLPAAAVALALLVLPLLGLYLWGTGVVLLAPGRPLASASAALRAEAALLNGALVPGLAILCLQLPVSYLAALSLALVRPFGRQGSRLVTIALLAGGFVPPLAQAIGLYGGVARAGLLNTPPAAGLPLMAGPASFLILKLYFDGQAPLLARGAGAGWRRLDVFLRIVWHPSLSVAALAGAASLLLAGQSFLWQLLVLSQSDYFPLSLQLVVHQARLGDPALLAAGAWLVLSVWGAGVLLLWWPLQALVLRHFRLEAGTH